MSIVAELVTRLIASGAAPDVAAVAVTEAFAAGAQSGGFRVESALEKRRAWDREYRRNKKQHPPESTRNPPDPPESEKHALSLKTDNKKEKKERVRRHVIPPEYQPSERVFELAAKMDIPRSAVLAKAEDLKTWAESTGELKASWDATLLVWLRRDRSKLAVSSEGPVKLSELTGFYAEFGSPEQDAWDSYYRRTKGLNAPRDKRGGWRFPSQWPPDYRMTSEGVPVRMVAVSEFA